MTPYTYPRRCIRQIDVSRGKVWEVHYCAKPHARTYLGQHDTEEEANKACDHFAATGEKPPRRIRHFKQHRVARIRERDTQRGKRWDVRGKIPNPPARQIQVHVGTFSSESLAEAALEKFLKTGEIQKKQERFIPSRKGMRKERPEPKPKPAPPARNLRDHEMVSRVKPVHGDRAIRPGESRIDWMKRITCYA